MKKKLAKLKKIEKIQPCNEKRQKIFGTYFIGLFLVVAQTLKML